jgi:hypothetical protein
LFPLEVIHRDEPDEGEKADAHAKSKLADPTNEIRLMLR